jgi:hypothetical protein
VRAAPGRLTRTRWDSGSSTLRASGARARPGVTLDAFYPGRGRLATTGLRRVAVKRVGGGSLIEGTARGGRWTLRAAPR